MIYSGRQVSFSGQRPGRRLVLYTALLAPLLLGRIASAEVPEGLVPEADSTRRLTFLASSRATIANGSATDLARSR